MIFGFCSHLQLYSNKTTVPHVSKGISQLSNFAYMSGLMHPRLVLVLILQVSLYIPCSTPFYRNLE